MFKLPFKLGESYGRIFRPIKGNLNEVSFRNNANGIKRLFTYASKPNLDNMPESVARKMNNTID